MLSPTRSARRAGTAHGRARLCRVNALGTTRSTICGARPWSHRSVPPVGACGWSVLSSTRSARARRAGRGFAASTRWGQRVPPSAERAPGPTGPSHRSVPAGGACCPQHARLGLGGAALPRQRVGDNAFHPFAVPPICGSTHLRFHRLRSARSHAQRVAAFLAGALGATSIRGRWFNLSQ